MPSSSTATTTPSIQYRPEIDGLRAVSVSLVVLFHAGFSVFKGGYVGVDIFYVISGYIITKLLVHELAETGTLDVLAFWGRRMRRILPAAVTVLCVSLAVGNFILPPLDVVEATKDLIAAALYYANWRFAETARNYFALGQTNIFLNYWSLAIEEQFYALWPLLLLAAAWTAGRLRRAVPIETIVFHLAACLLVLSFAYGLWLSTQDVALAFYSTFSRAWELCLGALVAASHVALTRSASTVLTCLGLIAIAGAATLIPNGATYPGLLTLIPTMGAAAVIAAHAEESPSNLASRFLRTRGMVLIGKVSYSWYLWHWPVFALGKAYLGDATLLQNVCLVCLSFGLAVATYVSIERPFRFAAPLVASRRLSILCGATLSLLAASFATLAQATFAHPFIVLSDGKRLDALKVMDQRGTIYQDGCHLSLLDTDYGTCSYGDAKGAHKALLFGDSIAAAWFPALQIAAESQHWQLISRTKSMCTPTVIAEKSPQLGRSYEECDTWRETVLQEAARQKPEIIFVASASAPPLKDFDENSPTAEPAFLIAEDILVRRLLETTDAELVLLRDVPTLGFHSVKCLLAHPGAEAMCASNLEDAMKRSQFPRGVYDGNKRVRIVDMGLEICPSGRCQAYQRGQIVMHDDVHLTPMYARQVSAPFAQILATYDEKRTWTEGTVLDGKIQR